LQHYLGHKSIVHTTRYTEMAADRFKDFWRKRPNRRQRSPVFVWGREGTPDRGPLVLGRPTASCRVASRPWHSLAACRVAGRAKSDMGAREGRRNAHLSQCEATLVL
jgi:hypothetical protein